MCWQWHCCEVDEGNLIGVDAVVACTRSAIISLFWCFMKRWFFRCIVASLAALGCGIGFVVACNAFILSQARPHIVAYQKAIPSKYVAIVLGARVYPNNRVSDSLRERLETAKWLYQQGKVKRILVSGDNRQAHYNEVRAMYLWLVHKGVPKKDIFLDYAGFRTLDTMQRASRVFQVKDAIICTQGFHMARAVYLAKRAGIDAVGMNSSGEFYHVVRRIKVREWIARTVAILDTHVLNRQPHHMGEAIPITGSATITHPKSF